MDDAAVATLLLLGVSTGAVRAALHALVYADNMAYEACRRWAKIAAGSVLAWIALGAAVEPHIPATGVVAALDCYLVAPRWSRPSLPRAITRSAS